MAHTTEEWSDNIADYRGRVHVAIITIKSEEEDEVLRRFPRQHSIRGERDYGLCRVDNLHGDRLLVACVRQPRQGNIYANTVTRDLIRDLEPEWILLVGIAGASPFGDAVIGDVVLGTHTHDLTVHTRNADGSTGFSAGGGAATVDVEATIVHVRPELVTAVGLARPHEPTTLVSLAFTTDDTEVNAKIAASLKARHGSGPRVVDGPIISTDALVKDIELVHQWRPTMRNALAIEMESAGAYNAARTRAKTYAMLPIRGISDIVGLEKQEGAVLQACRIAAECALAFVRHWYPNTGPAKVNSTDAPRTAPKPSVGVRWKVVIEGTVDDFSAIELRRMLEALRALADDASLSIVSVQSGSIVLICDTSKDLADTSRKNGEVLHAFGYSALRVVPSVADALGFRERVSLCLQRELREPAPHRSEDDDARSLPDRIDELVAREELPIAVASEAKQSLLSNMSDAPADVWRRVQVASAVRFARLVSFLVDDFSHHIIWQSRAVRPDAKYETLAALSVTVPEFDYEFEVFQAAVSAFNDREQARHGLSATRIPSVSLADYVDVLEFRGKELDRVLGKEPAGWVRVRAHWHEWQWPSHWGDIHFMSPVTSGRLRNRDLREDRERLGRCLRRYRSLLVAETASTPSGERALAALALRAGDVLDERLARRRLVVERVENQDARRREHVLKLSEQIAEECKRTKVWGRTTNFVLSEVGDEQVYGFLCAGPEGLSLAYRSSSDELEDAHNEAYDPTYHSSEPSSWPVEWLREVFEQRKLEELDEAIDAKLNALVDGASLRQTQKKEELRSDFVSSRPDNVRGGKPQNARVAPVGRRDEIPESLSRALGFLVESTGANVFHWSKELQYAATLEEQEEKLREINGGISAGTYKITPLHRKAVVEAAHETLDTLQALTTSAVELSAKHGLLWVSITKSVKQLANLYPYRPGESDNAPRMLVVGSDTFSLHFSELMAQLLLFLDGAAGAGIKPARESPYEVTVPFEPLTARVVSRQSQTNGALVVPALWRMVAIPSGSKKWTRAKVHDAVNASIPNTDGGTGRLTRWPAPLRPGSHEHTRDDSTYVWRVEEKGKGGGELHDEQLGVRTDGTLWFQRAHFWDAPTAQIVLELGRCAFDVVVFLKLLIGVGNQLGITSYGVDLCVEAPQAEMVATIKSNDLVAKQPLRTARTRRRRYDSHVDVGPMTSQSDPVQLKLVQELVDGIANELELAGDPFFQGGGKPFLEIDERSIESVLRAFK